MSIRIAGGYLRGRNLKTLSGRQTRPTTGRVREAIFSILQHDLENAELLDIFSGSGAIAIEAVSRGASTAVLIENNRSSLAVIRDNLKICNLDLRLLAVDYLKGMEILRGEGKKFDLIFADPPYGMIFPKELYQLILKYSLMKSEGLFIMEHDGGLKPQTDNILKTRQFGDSAITIFKNE